MGNIAAVYLRHHRLAWAGGVWEEAGGWEGGEIGGVNQIREISSWSTTQTSMQHTRQTAPEGTAAVHSSARVDSNESDKTESLR